MQQKVDVRFRINPKTYTYLSSQRLERGDKVIVESPLGQSFGTVERVDVETTISDDQLKKVVRKATEQDIIKNEKNCDKEHEAVLFTKKLVNEMNLDMNVVNAEYSFDGNKIIIDFISDSRVDFRELVKRLASGLKARIELKQIGTRDQAKMVGGIGICGRICCCASHLKDFEKVSMKMAKNQGLALNPTKISGACGRLMCCLEYEDPYYVETLSHMPKLNSEVKTPDGFGMVVYQNVLKQTVSVKLQTKDGSNLIKDYSIDIFEKQMFEGKQQSNSQIKPAQCKTQEKPKSCPQKENGNVDNSKKQDNSKNEQEKNKNGKRSHFKPHHKVQK